MPRPIREPIPQGAAGSGGGGGEIKRTEWSHPERASGSPFPRFSCPIVVHSTDKPPKRTKRVQSTTALLYNSAHWCTSEQENQIQNNNLCKSPSWHGSCNVLVPCPIKAGQSRQTECRQPAQVTRGRDCRSRTANARILGTVLPVWPARSGSVAALLRGDRTIRI